MSRFLLINFEEFNLNQDITKTIQSFNPFCICCLDKEGPMIDLENCVHSDYLDAFGKSELSQFNPLVCVPCHSFLRKIKVFETQVLESFNILLSGTYTNNTINSKRMNNLTKYDTTELLHLPPDDENINPNLNMEENILENIIPIPNNEEIMENIVTNSNMEENMIPNSNMEENMIPNSNMEENMIPNSNMEENMIPNSNMEENMIPNSNMEENMIPNSNMEENMIPNSNMEENMIPNSNMEENMIPNSNMEENMILNSNMEENMIPNSNMEENMIPNSNMEENMILNSNMEENMIPNSNMEENMIPNSNMEENMFPNSNMEENMIPNSNMEENMILNSNMEENMIPNSNMEENMIPNSNIETNPIENYINVELYDLNDARLNLELNRNIRTAIDIIERNNQSFVTLGGQLQFLNGEHLSFLEASLLSKEILTDIPLVPAKISTDLENGLVDNSRLEIEIDGPERIFYESFDLSPELLRNVSPDVENIVEERVEMSEPIKKAVKPKIKPKTVKIKAPQQIKPVRISQDELNKERIRKAQSEIYLKFKFRCETCLLGFNYQENLEDHNKRKHGPLQEDNVLCEICSQIIPTPGGTTEHYYRHYTRYDCVHCGKRYYTRDEATRHLLQNHARKRSMKKSKLMGIHKYNI